MSGGNSSNNGNRSDGSDDEGWGSKFFKVASAAAAAAAVAGGLYALVKSSSSSNSEPEEVRFKSRGGRVSKEPDDVDDQEEEEEEEADDVDDQEEEEEADDVNPWSLQYHDNIPSSQIGWTKPKSGWVKLNVDGSKVHKGRRSAGCGGVLRDESGEWRQGFAQKLDHSCKVHVTELLAILKGMELARDMNVKKLVVESDHKPAVSRVEKGCKSNHPQSDLISRIRQLRLDPKWQVEVFHIPRKANGVANRLARDARDLRTYDLCKYPFPPDNCTRLVKKDKQGGSYY